MFTGIRINYISFTNTLFLFFKDKQMIFSVKLELCEKDNTCSENKNKSENCNEHIIIGKYEFSKRNLPNRRRKNCYFQKIKVRVNKIIYFDSTFVTR